MTDDPRPLRRALRPSGSSVCRAARIGVDYSSRVVGLLLQHPVLESEARLGIALAILLVARGARVAAELFGSGLHRHLVDGWGGEEPVQRVEPRQSVLDDYDRIFFLLAQPEPLERREVVAQCRDLRPRVCERARSDRVVLGAGGLGMRTVFARYGDTKGNKNSGADHDIDDIFELVDIVDRLNQG